MGAPPSGQAAEGAKGGHQKMRSIDVQKPLINPWLAANHVQSHTGKHLTSKNIQMQEQQMINIRNQNQMMNDQNYKQSA